MRITHTNDSLNLLAFLEKYPNQWHGYSGDKRTLKAVERLKLLHSHAFVTSGFQQMFWDTSERGDSNNIFNSSKRNEYGEVKY